MLRIDQHQTRNKDSIFLYTIKYINILLLQICKWLREPFSWWYSMAREYPIHYHSIEYASLLEIGETSSRVMGPQANHSSQFSCIVDHK